MMEEEGMDELELGNIKLDNLRKSLEQVASKVSSIILFNLNWKDLEEHYEEVQKGLEERARLLQKEAEATKEVLKETNKEIESKQKELSSWEAQIAECNGQLEAKKKKVVLEEGRLNACSQQLNCRKMELASKLESIKDSCIQLKLKEEEFCSVKKSVEVCHEKLQGKRMELTSVEKELASCCWELNLKKQALDSVINLIEKNQEELTTKEQQLETVRKTLDEFSVEVSEKKKQTSKLQASLLERSRELELKEMDLDSKRSLVKACQDDIDVKTRNLELLQELTTKCSSQLDSKQKELISSEELVKRMAEEIKEKEQNVSSLMSLIQDYSKECSEEEKERDLINKSIAICSAELKSKRQELDEVKLEAQKVQKQLACKKIEIDSVEAALRRSRDNLEIKHRELDCLHQCITEKEKLLKSVEASTEECIKELTVKQQQLASIEKSMEERSKEVQLKEQLLATTKNSLEELFAQVESKKKEYSLIEKAYGERLKELELKEKANVYVKRSLDENLREVGIKEGQLKDHCKEFESKEKQMDATQQTVEEQRRELELKEKQLTETLGSHPLLLTAATDSRSQSAQLVSMMDGSSLQFQLNELLKQHDMVSQQVSSVIKAASDPGKLVLDAVKGIYPPHLRRDNIEFDADITMKSCILLLDQLIVYSPQIGPHVQQMAIEVACVWKKKMTVGAENVLEILGFLHLIAAFRIAYAFNMDELRALLDCVADHKQALKLWQHLKITEIATVSNITGKTEQLDNLTISTADETFSSDLETWAALDGGSLHVYDPAWAKEGILSAFRISQDKAKFVLDVIQGRLVKDVKKDQSHEAGFQDAALELCAVLLKQLLQVSPLVQSDVKTNAIKLAAEWKENLKPDTKNSLEVLLFVEFIAAYGLASSLDRNEGFQLLEIIAPHKEAPAICRALNFVDILTDAIQGLISKGHYIKAARIVHAYELADKFPTAQLLENYRDHIDNMAINICNKGKSSLEAQCRAIDEKIASQREILQCIHDFKLESQIPSRVVEECITELGKEKIRLRCSAAASTRTVQPRVPSKNKHPPATCPPVGQLELQSPVIASASGDQRSGLVNKRPRTDRSLTAPHTPESPSAI